MTLHDDLEKYEDFYNGKRATIFNEFKTRWVDTANVATSSQFNERNFFFQNDIRVIQDTRVSFMPGYFDVMITNGEDENEEQTAKVQEWLDGPYFGGGRSFWEALPGYYKAQENSGTLFLMMTRKEGVINISKLYSTDVTIVTNPTNVYEVTEYRFEWEEEIDSGEEGTRNEQMKLIVDKTNYRTTQGGRTIEEEAHGFGFIPIIKIVRDEVDGTPYGRSGIEDLIEPQNEVNVALTKRAWATKHNSFRVWCPKGNDGGISAGTSIVITPGSLVPIPIEAVGGDIDMTAVENELNDALDHLYRIGSVPRKMKEETAAEASSAKALNTLLQSLKIYTNRKLIYLKRGFEEMIANAFGIDLKNVVITWPSDDDEDPAQVIDRARFLSELGLTEEALRTLGYEDKAIEELMKQKEAADAEREAKAMELREKFMGDDESKDTLTEGQKPKSTNSSDQSDEQEETPSKK